MNRLALTGALAALAICAAPRLALASDADVVREYRDRGEIDALMWHYVHALDSLDENAYAANYTPDGSFKAGKSVSEGHRGAQENHHGREEAARRAGGQGREAGPAISRHHERVRRVRRQGPRPDPFLLADPVRAGRSEGQAAGSRSRAGNR